MVAAKKIERLERSRARLEVTVSGEDTRKAYDGLLVEYARNARVDGFRQGKVPASVLERKYGEELRLEAMGRVMDKAVEEALEGVEERPLAYDHPELEGQPEFKPGSDFAFSIVYDIFPTVNAGDWKGIEIELPAVEVAKADEDRELERIRERNAVVVEKDEGAKAAKGDIVTVDYRELDSSGATVADSARQDFVFELGTGHNLYKFDDEVVGMKKGEEKTFEKAYPADFEYPELAGATKRLAVKVTQLKARKLPDLDDELAQDVSEKFKTLADLRADVRRHLESQLEQRLRSLKEAAIVDALLERSTVELPESMVAAEVGMRWRDLMRQMGIEDESRMDRIVENSGRDKAGLFAEWRPSAEKALKTRLVLEKLVADGKYETNDADLEAEYAKMAGDGALSVEEVKAEYQKRGMVDYLKDRVREDKLMNDIIAAGKLKKGKKKAFVDLFEANE